MTIDELIGWLEDAKAEEGMGGESRVVLARQETYPFASSVGATCLDHTFRVETGYGSPSEVESVFVICEGAHLAYGDPVWWNGETIEREPEPGVFQVRPGEEPWLGAEPGWYCGLPEGDSEGSFDTEEQALQQLPSGARN